MRNAGEILRSKSDVEHSRTFHLGISAGLILLGALLYLPSINWGLPGVVSWSQDSIAGFRTLGATAEWPGDWKGRYPPLHYLILRAAYEPVLRHWHSQGAADFDAARGQYRLHEPQAPKVGALILIARVISVLMGIGTGLAIYVGGRRRLKDDWAGALAAGAFMIGADFTYFAHLDNVDVPSIFWFALSLIFFVRLLDEHLLRDAALLGLFGSLAIATKDGVAGVYPGLAICLLVERWRRGRELESAWSWPGAVLQPHWVVGILCFALPYLLINGALHNWEAFATRLGYWLNPPPEALHAQQHTYGSQWELMIAVVHYAASAVGWPMLAAMGAGLIYASFRDPRLALIAMLPGITYYLIVISSQGFVYSRFLFAPLVLMCLPLGFGARALLRKADWPIQARVMLLTLVALPTLGYAAAVDAELMTDSRYAAEAWFAEQVTPPSSVGAFAPGLEPTLRPQYLPRLHEAGYATYPVVMAREWFDRPQPEFLVVDGFTVEDFNMEQRKCLRALLNSELGYRVVALFEGRYIPPYRSWLAIAGWGTPNIGKVSPRLVILQQTSE